MGYVMNVNLVAKRWLIAQQSFDPRAFDAMEFAWPDGRVQKRGWEQEQLVFHERTSIADRLALLLARRAPQQLQMECRQCDPDLLEIGRRLEGCPMPLAYSPLLAIPGHDPLSVERSRVQRRRASAVRCNTLLGSSKRS
jgi:hypothetical protein